MKQKRKNTMRWLGLILAVIIAVSGISTLALADDTNQNTIEQESVLQSEESAQSNSHATDEDTDGNALADTPQGDGATEPGDTAKQPPTDDSADTPVTDAPPNGDEEQPADEHQPDQNGDAPQSSPDTDGYVDLHMYLVDRHGGLINAEGKAIDQFDQRVSLGSQQQGPYQTDQTFQLDPKSQVGDYQRIKTQRDPSTLDTHTYPTSERFDFSYGAYRKVNLWVPGTDHEWIDVGPIKTDTMAGDSYTIEYNRPLDEWGDQPLYGWSYTPNGAVDVEVGAEITVPSSEVDLYAVYDGEPGTITFAYILFGRYGETGGLGTPDPGLFRPTNFAGDFLQGNMNENGESFLPDDWVVLKEEPFKVKNDQGEDTTDIPPGIYFPNQEVRASFSLMASSDPEQRTRSYLPFDRYEMLENGRYNLSGDTDHASTSLHQLTLKPGEDRVVYVPTVADYKMDFHSNYPADATATGSGNTTIHLAEQEKVVQTTHIYNYMSGGLNRKSRLALSDVGQGYNTNPIAAITPKPDNYIFVGWTRDNNYGTIKNGVIDMDDVAELREEQEQLPSYERIFFHSGHEPIVSRYLHDQDFYAVWAKGSKISGSQIPVYFYTTDKAGYPRDEHGQLSNIPNYDGNYRVEDLEGTDTLFDMDEAYGKIYMDGERNTGSKTYIANKSFTYSVQIDGKERWRGYEIDTLWPADNPKMNVFYNNNAVDKGGTPYGISHSNNQTHPLRVYFEVHEDQGRQQVKIFDAATDKEIDLLFGMTVPAKVNYYPNLPDKAGTSQKPYVSYSGFSPYLSNVGVNGDWTLSLSQPWGEGSFTDANIGSSIFTYWSYTKEESPLGVENADLDDTQKRYYYYERINDDSYLNDLLFAGAGTNDRVMFLQDTNLDEVDVYAHWAEEYAYIKTENILVSAAEQSPVDKSTRHPIDEDGQPIVLATQTIDPAEFESRVIKLGGESHYLKVPYGMMMAVQGGLPKNSSSWNHMLADTITKDGNSYVIDSYDRNNINVSVVSLYNAGSRANYVHSTTTDKNDPNIPVLYLGYQREEIKVNVRPQYPGSPNKGNQDDVKNNAVYGNPKPRYRAGSYTNHNYLYNRKQLDPVPGYTFLGWSTAPDAIDNIVIHPEDSAVGYYLPNHDVTFYGQWLKDEDAYGSININRYLTEDNESGKPVDSDGQPVTLVEDAYSVVEEKMTDEHGSSQLELEKKYYPLAHNFTKDGYRYKFIPASEQQGGDKHEKEIYLRLNHRQDAVNYGYVKRAGYEITYDSNIPAGSSDFASAIEGALSYENSTFHANERINPELADYTNLPSEYKYVFKGWSENKNGSGSIYSKDAADGTPTSDDLLMPEKDITLYAVWQKYDHIITFTAGENGTLEGGRSEIKVPVLAGERFGNVDVPEAIPDEYYTFTHWSPTLPGDNDKILSDMSFTAQFAGQSTIVLKAADATKTYDGQPLEKNAYSILNSPEGFDITIEATVRGSVTHVDDVTPGNNKITSYKVFDGNQDITQYVTVILEPGNLVVTPRDATITIDPKSKTEGDADPAFTGSVSGLLDERDLGDVTYKRLDADANKQSAGDDITIVPTYTENTNYNVTVASAKLTILPLDRLEIRFRAGEGGAINGATNDVVISGIAPGTQFANITVPTITANEGYRFVGWTPELPSQNSSIHISAIYTAQFAKKNALTIKAESAEKTYDGKPLTNPNYTLESGTLESGDSLKVTVEGSVTDVQNTKGNNKVTSAKVVRGILQKDVTDEYEIKTLDGDLMVRQRVATIDVHTKTKTEGAADPAFTGKVSNLVKKNDLGAVGYARRAADAGKEKVGDDITLVAKYTQNPNYTVAVHEGKLIIVAGTTPPVTPTPTPPVPPTTPPVIPTAPPVVPPTTPPVTPTAPPVVPPTTPPVTPTPTPMPDDPEDPGGVTPILPGVTDEDDPSDPGAGDGTQPSIVDDDERTPEQIARHERQKRWQMTFWAWIRQPYK